MIRTLLLLLLLAAPAVAQIDPVKARKDNFHMLSDQVRDIVKGLGDGLPVSAMRGNAEAASQAMARIPSLFPPGSDQGRTKALPVIWTDPARFDATYKAAADRMAELVAAASNPSRDAFGAAAGRLAASCGDCHTAFRAQ